VCQKHKIKNSKNRRLYPFLSFFILCFKHAIFVEPSGVQALKNPNPLKDVEALGVLVVAMLF